MIRSAGNGETGAYTVGLTAIADDRTDSPVGAAPLSADWPVSGALETSGDEDWFTLTMSEGWLYAVSCETRRYPLSTGEVVVPKSYRSSGSAGTSSSVTSTVSAPSR